MFRTSGRGTLNCAQADAFAFFFWNANPRIGFHNHFWFPNLYPKTLKLSHEDCYISRILLVTFHFRIFSTRASIPFDTHVLSTYSTIKEEFNKLRTRDLIKLFEQNGWCFLNHGGNHDIYINGNLKEQIVRHKETNEHLAKALIRKYDLK